jgi:hypothetical protein
MSSSKQLYNERTIRGFVSKQDTSYTYKSFVIIHVFVVIVFHFSPVMSVSIPTTCRSAPQEGCCCLSVVMSEVFDRLNEMEDISNSKWR